MKEHNFTIQHMERVALYSYMIATEMHLPDRDRVFAYFAGLLHDIGKDEVDEELLLAPRRLTEEEFERIKLHTLVGYNMLMERTDIVPSFKRIAEAARWHHERLDGSGYPDGLKGEEIPFLARLVSVADAFDAMTDERPYRKAKSIDEAFVELSRCAGTQFDPEIVAALKEAIRKQKEKEQ